MSYEQILRDLDILNYNPKNTPNCNSDSVNLKKLGKNQLIIQNLHEISNVIQYITFLKFVGTDCIVTLSKKKEHNIMSQKAQDWGF